MDTLRQDLAVSLRRLLRSPGFALTAILTVAIGIGANTAMFSVVNGVLLRPLPYPGADRIVRVYSAVGDQRWTVSPQDYRNLAAENRTLERAAFHVTTSATLTGGDEPVRLRAAVVTAGFFDVLGVSPARGRTFAPDENEPGRNRVAVLGHGVWLQQFGGDPALVGRSVILNSEPHTVIGIMPAGFDHPGGRQVWLPEELSEHFWSNSRGAQYLSMIGRLRPGTTAEEASADLATIAARLERLYPATNANKSAVAVPLHETLVAGVRPALLAILGAVGLVLLIACANVANLLLVRVAARETEIAVRLALGASRRRLVRHLLTESLLLAACGGAAGLLLAAWGIDLLVAFQPRDIPRLDQIRIDRAVLAFATAASVLTGIIFGLIPAFNASRPDLARSLKAGGRGAIGAASARLRGSLVVLEIALAVVLLAGAGLLLKSFTRLTAVDPGFHTENALVVDIDLPAAAYPERQRVAAFYRGLTERLAALPGVTAVGGVSHTPLAGSNFGFTFTIDGRPTPDGEDEGSLQTRVVAGDYFAAMGIPLRQGRAFSNRDRADAPGVAVITEGAARRFWPGEDPIGQVIRLGWTFPGDQIRAEIVGIVGDIRHHGLDADVMPTVYLPHDQIQVGSLNIVLRTAGDPEILATAVRAEVHAADPDLPVTNIRTLRSLVEASVAQPRFYTLLLSIFSAVALTLAAIGVFGIVSFAVAQRTREFGVRIALGAPTRSIFGLVVGSVLQLALAGIGLGLLGAALAARGLRGLLFGIGHTDPLTYAAVAATLLTVALLAAFFPARAAVGVDPLVALRQD